MTISAALVDSLRAREVIVSTADLKCLELRRTGTVVARLVRDRSADPECKMLWQRVSVLRDQAKRMDDAIRHLLDFSSSNRPRVYVVFDRCDTQT